MKRIFMLLGDGKFQNDEVKILHVELYQFLLSLLYLSVCIFEEEFS